MHFASLTYKIRHTFKATKSKKMNTPVVSDMLAYSVIIASMYFTIQTAIQVKQ